MHFKFMFPAIALLVIITIYGSTGHNEAEKTSYNTALRLIGHRLLVSAGNTRSRVMPIRQLPDQTYQIHFETPLSLEPDSLVSIISKTAKQALLPDDYTADVLDCAGNEVVYSFVMSGDDSNVMVPCIGRTLPKACYFIRLHFLPASLSAFKSSYWWGGSLLLLLLLAYGMLSRAKRKKNQPFPVKEDVPAVKTTLAIGGFLFHVDQRYLEMDGERIELTEKETKLLHIFAAAPNKTIDREQLQKEVWENEGVIVTRSLDVFVSKLRKKLDKDPNIKLVNVHGKGYKLEKLTP